MKIALIVEGQSDQDSFPTLVAKIGELVGTQIFAPKPIRAGPYAKLAKQGNLERFVELGASRDVDAIIVAVDLDDGCHVTAAMALDQRRQKLQADFGIPIYVCLVVREFETWFLQDIQNIKESSPEFGWNDEFRCDNPKQIRGAKELLSRSCAKGYKEITDQKVLVKKIDLKNLYERDRCFRHLAKAVSGMGYDELGSFFG